MPATGNGRAAKNWIVKSSTKILGPFTREEVITLLSRRQITIIDEIRQPEGRWNYIREHRHFKEIVKNLRYEQDHSRDDTMTSTVPLQTQTASINQTQTMTKTDPASMMDDFTPTPVTPPGPPPAGKGKPLIKDVTPLDETPPAKTIPTPMVGTKSYGAVQDRRLRQKLRKQSLILRIVFLGLALAAAGFVIWSSLHKEKKAEMSWDQLLAMAVRYKELGLYDRALTAYKKAAAVREPDLETQFQLSLLLINQDRQSLTGRRIIERAQTKDGRTPRDLLLAQLGIGLSYMMDGDYDQANEFLQKALGYDPNSEFAKVDHTLILMKKGDYKEAYHTFDGLSVPSSSAYPLVLLSKAISLIEISKERVDTDRLQKLANEIRTWISKSHFLRKELSLLMIYVEQLAGDAAGTLDAINFFLEEPQGFSALYTHHPAVDWRNADWESLEKYCGELYDSGKGPSSLKAVRAVCLLETNRDLEASKLLDEALAQAPKQVNVLEAQAQYLWKLGRTKEAQTLFSGPETKNLKLLQYLQGDTCMKAKDFSCAEVAYKNLLDKDAGDVVAHYGLAKLAMAHNDKAKAQSEIKAGFESENNFIPLIELREKLESP